MPITKDSWNRWRRQWRFMLCEAICNIWHKRLFAETFGSQLSFDLNCSAFSPCQSSDLRTWKLKSRKKKKKKLGAAARAHTARQTILWLKRRSLTITNTSRLLIWTNVSSQQMAVWRSHFQIKGCHETHFPPRGHKYIPWHLRLCVCTFLMLWKVWV